MTKCLPLHCYARISLGLEQFTKSWARPFAELYAFYPPLKELSQRFNGIISKLSRGPTNHLGSLARLVVEICMGSDDARKLISFTARWTVNKRIAGTLHPSSPLSAAPACQVLDILILDLDF